MSSAQSSHPFEVSGDSMQASVELIGHARSRSRVDAASPSLQGLTTWSRSVLWVVLHSLDTRKISSPLATLKDPCWVFIATSVIFKDHYGERDSRFTLLLLGPRFHGCRKNANPHSGSGSNSGDIAWKCKHSSGLKSSSSTTWLDVHERKVSVPPAPGLR